MEKALTKAEQNALVVSYDVGGNHVELDLEFVKKYLVNGDASRVTDQELLFYMNTCKMQRLNPLVSGESYLIKYGDKPAQLVIGKAAYLKRAFNNPNYLYKKDGIVVQRGKDIVKKQGCAVYPGENLLAGWCEVYYKRNGTEYSEYKEVSLSEYNQQQANWKSKPATMLNKVSVSQCLREAFPDDYEGLYSEDEMIASGVVRIDNNGDVIAEDPSAESQKETILAEEDPIITREQRHTLFNTAKSAFGEEGNDILKKLISEVGYESTNNLTASAFKKVMGMLFDLCEAKKEEEAQRACEAPEESDEPVEE